MSKVIHKFGLNDIYPKSSTVLLWIGSAIAIIISASWVLTNVHHHSEYTTIREFRRVVDMQKESRDQLNHLANTIYDQTMILNELKGEVKWLAQQER